MGNSSGLKPILVSVVLTSVIVGLGFSIGLPYLFPSLENGDSDIVQQTLYVSSTSPSGIDDRDTNLTLIPYMNSTITIENNSRISSVFSGNLHVTLGVAFNTTCEFEIQLSLANLINRTFNYKHTEFTSFPEEPKYYSFSIYLDLVSDPLPAGDYEVTVRWRSKDSIDSVYAGFYFSNMRSLLIKELS